LVAARAWLDGGEIAALHLCAAVDVETLCPTGGRRFYPSNEGWPKAGTNTSPLLYHAELFRGGVDAGAYWLDGIFMQMANKGLVCQYCCESSAMWRTKQRYLA
jgi:hypothetical protein